MPILLADTQRAVMPHNAVQAPPHAPDTQEPRMPASTQSSRPGDILLDAGTNELEVLVFTLCGGSFGVNVAKVREVIRPVKAVSTPHKHPSVIGMFNIRGTVMPVVDLAKHLGLREDSLKDDSVPEKRVIITEFNGLHTGFLVDTVEQIHRMSWQKVQPTPDLNVGAEPAHQKVSVSSTTGIIDMDGKLILMIDFESVADAILHEERLHVDKVDNVIGVDRASKRVILAEDSPFMRSIMTKVFKSSGYAQIEIYPDGQAAWEAVASNDTPPDAVVSDIEMPRMDGLHLTKRIKGDKRFENVPVVLFSSLVSKDNEKKGQQVGATVQIPKPELAEMVRIVDRVVSGETVKSAATAELGAERAALIED